MWKLLNRFVFKNTFIKVYMHHYSINIFLIHTVQRRRSQHARTLTPMNTRTQILPLWAPPNDWAPTHHWHLVVDGNIAYHLTPENPEINLGKGASIGIRPWWVASHWTVLPLDYKPNRYSINIFIIIRGQNCILETVSLSET
jgi:hypothetical protein